MTKPIVYFLEYNNHDINNPKSIVFRRKGQLVLTGPIRVEKGSDLEKDLVELLKQGKLVRQEVLLKVFVGIPLDPDSNYVYYTPEEYEYIVKPYLKNLYGSRIFNDYFVVEGSIIIVPPKDPGTDLNNEGNEENELEIKKRIEE